MFNKLISSLTVLILKTFWNSRETEKINYKVPIEFAAQMSAKSSQSIESIYASTTSLQSVYISLTDYENVKAKCDPQGIFDVNKCPIKIKTRSKLTKTDKEITEPS